MYKRILLPVFILFLFLSASAQNGWITLKPFSDSSYISEVSVFHCECTGSRSVDIDSGQLAIPDSIRNGQGFSTMDISKEVFQKLFGSGNDNRLEYMYLIRGKVSKILDIGFTPKAGPRYIPYFEVYQYKLIRKTLQLAPSLADWKNVDANYGPLPSSVHVYAAEKWIVNANHFRAYYVSADLKDKKLDFTVDTTFRRRLTPAKYYEKNKNPLLVVNTTFFSFATNQNLNVVLKNKKLVGYNIHTINGRGKDTFTYRHPFGSAIGISKKREADVAWLYTDSSMKYAYAIQGAIPAIKDSAQRFTFAEAQKAVLQSIEPGTRARINFGKWKMRTAVGGGPVLIQNGAIKITNNEEMKFTGKAINDRHPRTAMGYTKENKLIILVVEGRNPGVAEGVTLTELAELMLDLGCLEALNLDGGGSSCMLVNGKETIKVSDAGGQRPVPAVFMIRQR